MDQIANKINGDPFIVDNTDENNRLVIGRRN